MFKKEGNPTYAGGGDWRITTQGLSTEIVTESLSQKKLNMLNMAVHACSLSYTGDSIGQNCKNLSEKTTKAQVVHCLLSKSKALSSNSATVKKKQRVCKQLYHHMLAWFSQKKH
jgi:hypothetical protein